MTILTRTSTPAPLALSEFSTTGSISAGSDQLTVADASGFTVGDWVIIATGGEAGGGTRGTGLGVGGAWPALSYANATAMNADTSQANLTCCWLQDTGVVRYWNGSTWLTPAGTEWYPAQVVPKALVAEILEISGSVLTLSKTASAATTDANVYFDNWTAIQGSVTERSLTVLPSGTFAVSDFLFAQQKPEFVLRGQGQDLTKLFTPPGASHGGVLVLSCVGPLVADFTWDMNFFNDSFSWRWADGRAAGFGHPTWPETWRGTGEEWGHGVKFASCTNGAARRVRILNGSQQAVTASACTDTWAYRCSAKLIEPHKQYIQWIFQWSDSTRGGCVECDIDSAFLIAGFEPFNSTGVQFLRCVGINAPAAGNASDDVLFDSHTLIVKEGSATASWSPNNPLFNFNTNVGVGFNTIQNRIINPTVIIEGYPDTGSPSRPNVINLSGSTGPLLVSGTYDTDTVAPRGLIDMRPAATATMGRGINADGAGTNVTVEGIRIKGDPPTGGTSMISSGGTLSVTNSIFDDTSPDGGGSFTLSGNQTNAEYEA